MPITCGRRALLAALATPIAARAASAAEPPILLTVTGRIAAAPGEARFDRASLEALGRAEIRTNTPWYPGPSTFTGVPLLALLEAVGASGSSIAVTALDDYTQHIHLSEIHAHDPILAMARNGRTLTLEDKGPLFVVFPYDEIPALRRRSFAVRSVWQVDRIEVE